MLRSPPAPSSTKLPVNNEWPAAWKSQVDKALGPGATDLQHEDARRMASALTAMRKKDVPEIKARLSGGKRLSGGSSVSAVRNDEAAND